MKRATSKKEPVKSSAKEKTKETKKPSLKEVKATPKTTKEMKTKTSSSPQATTPPATLGVKRGCPKCSTKFYDFARSPILCPKCGTEVDPEAAMPSLPRAPEPKKKAVDKTTDAILAGDEGTVELDVFESTEDLSDDVEVEIPVDSDDDEF